MTLFVLSMCFSVEIGQHFFSYPLANTEDFSRRLSSHTFDLLLDTLVPSAPSSPSGVLAAPPEMELLSPCGLCWPSPEGFGLSAPASQNFQGHFLAPAPPLQHENCDLRGTALPLLITAVINCWNIFTLESQLMRYKPLRASTGCKKKKKKASNKNLMALEELHELAYKLPECIHERKKKSFLQQLEKQD